MGTRTYWLNNATTLWVGCVLGVIVLIALALLLRRMRKIRKEYRESLTKRYTPEEIICHDNAAQYLGMESFSGKQTGGSGVLILAKKELYFFRVHPKIELSIPVRRIKRVITPSRFLGKSTIKPMLKVDFIEEDGAPNAVAWQVVDLPTFKKALQLQRKKVVPKKMKK